ncbi:DUF1553 domain-containing protein [Tautonia sociabilis]|uniref:DUF1553 domain-containing protein n=1 Tax=Tautonia sociabilis TaxID=2080755 RepID=A0A432MF98_9BACT|nr:DUF1553 domain-containing protein [Tautonia sociabilis]RUL84682.1 DUF1553 domain-containing protein [Tautonia sociabilis]
MRRPRTTLRPVVIGLMLLPAASRAEDSAPDAFFEATIRPILAERCQSCHDSDAPEAGLSLSSRAALLSGGDSGPAAEPGDPEASLIVEAIRYDSYVQMPPNGKLPPDEIAALERWIELGLPWPGSPDEEASSAREEEPHWSFLPIREPPPPEVDHRDLARSPIDRFILRRLEAEGLSPSPEADRRTLIRRVCLDLIGLPPTPEEVDAFLDDDRPDAFERLVDRLLASPHYGERQAQHWLDVIRWAETWGFETNSPRPNSWPYRDWVIRAINDDLPYDRFLFHQLAGDLVSDDAATGLLVSGPANLPGQIGKDEESMRQARQDELDETVRTVGEAFLGLTIGCARCHSHKFDPISQRDYYAFQAVFSGLRYGDRRLRGPEDDRWASQAAEMAGTIQSLRDQLEERRLSLGLRPPLSPSYQEDCFDPIEATAVRITILATHNNGRASLDELEVWSADPEPVNVALSSRGGRASASSFALENQTRHPDNLIDGKTLEEGAFPWIVAQAGPAWARVDLAEPTRIDRIAWRRGYDGFPTDYEVEVLLPDGSWLAVSNSRDRLLHEEDRRAADAVTLSRVEPEEVAGLVSLLAEIRRLDGERSRLAAGPQVFSGLFGSPEPTYLLRRGDPMQRLDPVPPDAPDILGSLDLPPDAPDPERRAALARHLTDPSHPLTARVMVNRVWQSHFGTGLVSTPSDFGRMGQPPSHPELLDWLAAEFVRGGWSVKRLHRLIVTSATYRQASTPRTDAIAVDADSRLLWRFPPRRLEAEAIRDAILRVSGSLNDQMEGPGFDFFNQKGGLSDYIPVERFGPDGWRRMIYATKIRMQSVDVFGAFDCPDAGQMTPKRSQSITPIQALGLWNSPFALHQSSRFADRVRDEAGAELADQIDRAVRLALGRPPTDDEADSLAALALEHGLEQACRVLLNTNEFVLIP